MTKSLLQLLLGYCIIGTVHAYDPLDIGERTDYVEPEERWQEDAITLPKQYDPDDLQPFTIEDTSDRFSYAIERKSLIIGSDGVARFLVVIHSSRGAVNSSYEGLRCGHREYKVYAYGSGRGLIPLPGGEWQTIPKGTHDYRAALYEDLICNLATGAPNPSDAVLQAMRGNRRVDGPFIISSP
ncbi:MAG: CNP1-like family protein [Candidatus Thiodiazotropha sp.]